MWSALRWVVLRLAAVNWLLKTIGGFAILVPIAFVLKMIGLPLLAILSAIALPVLIVLFIFGLPIFLVLIFGGMIMGLVGFVLTIGLAAIKIGIFVVLPIWLVFKLCSWIFRKRGPDAPPASPPPSAAASEPAEPEIP